MAKEFLRKVASVRRSHTEQLQSFGYQDVYVEVANGFNPTTKVSSIYGMEAFFWNGNYGYKLYLSVRPCSGQFDITDPRFSITSWLFLISVYTAKEAEILNTVNIREYITQYFAKFSEFLNIERVSITSHEDAIMLDGFIKTAEIKFSFHLDRSDVKYDLEHPYEDDEDDELPDGHEFIKEFEQNFDKFLTDVFFNEKLALNGHEIEIGRDLFGIRLTVYNHSTKYHLGVRSYKSNLFDDDTENAIRDIIWSFLHEKDNQESFCLSLHEDHFHIIDETVDHNSCIAYRNLNPYKITVHVEQEQTLTRADINFDCMDGHTFEQFCAEVLSKNDFEKITVTRGSGDQGVDIIAFKDGIKYGIQCKCYSSDIGNKAVQEVFAGKTFYECHVGAVLTNQHFTKSAIELARKNGILLWDRKKLTDLIKKAHLKVDESEALL